MKGATISEFGTLIDSGNGAALIALVNEVADAIGAKRPDNIVLGLQPSFYVTAAKLSLNGSTDALELTTLYISLPFLNILNIDEIRSVIGHEMGHFKGKDNEYSLRFYPAYSRLGAAISTLSGDSEENNFVNVPTLAFHVLLHDEFLVVERKIGREREIRADQEGAKVGSARGLATALLKFSEYSQLWGPIRNHNAEASNEGRVYNDLSNLYYDVALDTYSNMDFAARINELLAFEMSHPNDTHPTLRERLVALDIEASSLAKDDLAPAESSVAEQLEGYVAIADELTIAEHRLMIGLGYASLPEQDNSGEHEQVS